MTKVGTVVGHYRLLHELGRGSFGITYLAEDTRLGSKLVVKIAERTEDSLARQLEQEAVAVASIDHPNLAKVYEAGQVDGRPFLAAEFVDGDTLEHILRSGGKLTLPQALRVTRAITRGLTALHADRLIHRDIKPSNIIVPKSSTGGLLLNQTKLVDFGALGRLLAASRDDDLDRTVTGQFVGTPRYMAPEQLLATPQTAATDVYGVGVVLFEILFGHRPFEGVRIPEFLNNRLYRDVTIPDDPQIPEGVRLLLRSCLARDPSARPASAKELLAAIDQLLATPVPELSPPAMPATPEGRADVASPAPERSRLPAMTQAPRESGDSRLAPHSDSLRFGLLAGSSLVVLAAGVAAFWWWVPLPSGAMGSLRSPAAALAGIFVGMSISVGGLFLRAPLRRWLARRRTEVERDAGQLLLGTKSRDALSESIALSIDELLLKCRNIEERILGLTIVTMVKEYEASKTSNDRQAALMNAAQLLEKLMGRLSPWYVRHEKLIAQVVSLVTAVSGAATVAVSVAKIMRNS